MKPDLPRRVLLAEGRQCSSRSLCVTVIYWTLPSPPTCTTLGGLTLAGAALLEDLLDSLTALAVSVAMSRIPGQGGEHMAGLLDSPITGLVTTPTAPQPSPEKKPGTPELAAP